MDHICRVFRRIIAKQPLFSALVISVTHRQIIIGISLGIAQPLAFCRKKCRIDLACLTVDLDGDRPVHDLLVIAIIIDQLKQKIISARLFLISVRIQRNRIDSAVQLTGTVRKNRLRAFSF